MEPTVATMMPHFAELEKKRALCRALMGGTAAMISAGETYLPKHPEESDPNYQLRLKENILTNFVSQAISKSTGKIFSKPLVFKEDVPEEIKTICQNIDKHDRTLNAFLLDRVKQSFEDGISYLLVDMPEALDVKTRADEKKKNIRPYVVPIDAQNLLEVLIETIDNKPVITRVRIMESEQEKVGEWGFRYVDQVRVLRREVTVDDQVIITFELYRQNTDKEWISVKKGFTTFKEIGLLPIYANRTGFYEGEPVFQETAELNLEHWRSKGEQLHCLKFGRFAMLGGSGVSEDKENPVAIGPSKKLFTTDPQGKFYYIESDGVGLEHGWKHLERIEKSISTASAQLRIEDKGKITATAAALDSDETNAGLKAVSGGIEDTVSKLFQLLSDLMGLNKSGGHIELNSNFGAPKGSDIGLQEISKLVVAGKLSTKGALKNFKWRGELPPDFDPEQDAKDLAAEPKDEEDKTKGVAK